MVLLMTMNIIKCMLHTGQGESTIIQGQIFVSTCMSGPDILSRKLLVNLAVS